MSVVPIKPQLPVIIQFFIQVLVFTERADGTYLVSVRAPLDNKQGADELCRQFPTGGGRAAAAGINALPGDQLDAFIDALRTSYD